VFSICIGGGSWDVAAYLYPLHFCIQFHLAMSFLSMFVSQSLVSIDVSLEYWISNPIYRLDIFDIMIVSSPQEMMAQHGENLIVKQRV
jgi:hypothetical protein